MLSVLQKPSPTIIVSQMGMRTFITIAFALTCWFSTVALALTEPDFESMITDIKNNFEKALTLKSTALVNNFYNPERKQYCAYLYQHALLNKTIIMQLSIFDQSLRLSVGPDAERALKTEFENIFSTLKEIKIYTEREAREDGELLKRYCPSTDGKHSAIGNGAWEGKATDSAIDDTPGALERSFFILPDTPRSGVVINFPEKQMYVYSPVAKNEGPAPMMAYPFKLLRVESSPFGATSISAKRTHPSDSFAIYFWGNRGVIHGPAKQHIANGGHHVDSMGSARNELELSRDNIARLFQHTKIGDKVLMVNQPVKVGWLGHQLYIEVHPPFGEDTRTVDDLNTDAVQLINRVSTGRTSYILDTPTLKQALIQRRGIPIRIGSETNVQR